MAQSKSANAGGSKKSVKRAATNDGKPVNAPPAKGSGEELVMFITGNGKGRMIRRKDVPN